MLENPVKFNISWKLIEELAFKLINNLLNKFEETKMVNSINHEVQRLLWDPFITRR